MSGLRRQLDPARLFPPARQLFLILAIGVLGLSAARAHADPARARAHFELGRRYFQVDEYGKAIEEFKAAHIEEADPAFLYNIAECHRHMGASKEALVYYKRFLNLTPPGAPSRANAEKRIAELQGATTPAPPATAPVTTPAPPAAPSETRLALAPRPVDAPPTTVAIAAPPASGLVTSADGASAPADQTSRPFYKSGWFFVVVGAVVVAGAAGVWLAASNRNGVPDSALGNQGVFK